jgi:serine/threonine protein phosphatase PrpC
VDSCHNSNGEDNQSLSELNVLSLKHGDRLLVPQYLYGRQLKSEGLQYRILRYSSTIRPVFSGNSVASTSSFDEHGSVTMVLPDHFYCGNFDCFKDRFPAGTNFILCSDGFYGSFSDWQQLWAWLQENAKGLVEDNKRKAILEQLHVTLNAKGGDDDISFIWVQPRQSKKRRC